MHTLITGGAGFIGCNLADRLLSKGGDVVVFDNFSRAGSKDNATWLRERHARGLTIVEGDVREVGGKLAECVRHAEALVHLAGQVAVTNSMTDPRHDFEVNALGTFNVLEAVRASSRRPSVLFSSTNKVYGGMEDVAVSAGERRYRYDDLPFGVSEDRTLDFHSPYGCSKGAADQYVVDYGRVFGLPTVVFRQSCIYGTRQFGTEDQGWAAHLAYNALTGRPIFIYGDGRQVRDMLYVDDLLDAYEAAIARSGDIAGRAFNVGGGPANTCSLLEFVERLEKHVGRKLDVRFGDWRPGDQRIYVSDIRKASAALGWAPRHGIDAGLAKLIEWVDGNRGLMSRGAHKPVPGLHEAAS